MLVPKLRFKREDGTDYPEWEEKKLGAIGKAIIGSGFSKKYQGHKDLPIPFYKVSDMNNVGNEIVMNNSNNYVSEELLLKMGLKACQQNAIIFAKVGAALMLDRKRIANKPFLVDNNMMIFMPNENNELRYIYHWLTSIRLSKYAQIGALPSFNASDIEYVIIPLPCLEEQQKIANFLSNVDEVIAQSEAEVANLQHQKKAAMQKIFSQEVRFKREDGTSYPEWNSKSFSDNFSSLNNNTFSRNMLSESGSVCNIHYGDIFVKYGEICDVQKENIPKVNDHIDTGKYDLLQDGDIILADTAEDETVGKATEILNVDTATVISGLHTMACRPNYKFAPMYLGYYINSPTYHNQLLPFMQGIKVTSIGRKNISETSISFPCLEEQQKIADFLSAYDEAISYAKQELDKWKELKKGLLQQMFA